MDSVVMAIITSLKISVRFLCFVENVNAMLSSGLSCPVSVGPLKIYLNCSLVWGIGNPPLLIHRCFKEINGKWWSIDGWTVGGLYCFKSFQFFFYFCRTFRNRNIYDQTSTFYFFDIFKAKSDRGSYWSRNTVIVRGSNSSKFKFKPF